MIPKKRVAIAVLPGSGPEADACPGSKHITRSGMVFDESWYPNGPRNGSSRDHRPSDRHGHRVTNMPKP